MIARKIWKTGGNAEIFKEKNWKMSAKKWRSKSLSWVGDVSGSLINSPA